MSDQPATLDRGAMIEAVGRALHRTYCGCGSAPPQFVHELSEDDLHDAEVAVDVLLPLLTDALDRARQQGRDDALGVEVDGRV